MSFAVKGEDCTILRAVYSRNLCNISDHCCAYSAC